LYASAICFSSSAVNAPLPFSAIRAISFLIETRDSSKEVIQHLLSLFTQYEGKPVLQRELVVGILRIADARDGTLIGDTEWFLRILVLLGSSEAVASDRTSLSRIVSQYKSISSMDPVDAMKISVAAVTNPKLQLPIDIVDVCFWVVGKYAIDHWQSEHFTAHNCRSLLSVVVSKLQSTTSVPLEILVFCITSCLWFIGAACVHLESSDLVDDLRLVLGSPASWAKQHHDSITLSSVLKIYESILDELPASSNDMDSVKNMVGLDGDQKGDIPLPADMDVPLIAIPDHMNRSICKTQAPLVAGNVYSVLDEEYKRLLDVTETTASATTTDSTLYLHVLPKLADSLA
jgi:hypothetical protein